MRTTHRRAPVRWWGAMQIAQLMSVPAVTCRADDTLHTAAQLMWDHDCGVLPVVARSGTLLGIITDRDICMATYTTGKPPRAIQVEDTMATPVFACHPADRLEAAQQLMRERQVYRVPVIDDLGHLVGLLSLDDIARYAAAAAGGTRLGREVVETLAAVRRTRPAMA